MSDLSDTLAARVLSGTGDIIGALNFFDLT